MKDNFSAQSDQYAQYRPVYPPEVFQYINSLVPEKNAAWDCGTGNGQVARELAQSFRQVDATDISQAQLDHAFRAPNIRYSVQPAEQTGFADHIFDLVVVAQAIHWFDFDRFYKEVRRTAKPGAICCVLGYGRMTVSAEIDALINNFYERVIGSYWDAERKYLDEHYHTIPFPFPEVETPEFVNIQQWTLKHVIGYLNTWSAVRHYMHKNGKNPVDALKERLADLWGNDAEKSVCFPLLIRVGIVEELKSNISTNEKI